MGREIHLERNRQDSDGSESRVKVYGVGEKRKKTYEISTASP